MTAERPRRSARVPAKFSEDNVPAVTPPSAKKRKAPPREDTTSLDFLLSNPKSALVTLDLSTLINENTWMALSQDSRDTLSTLLPPTVFPFFKPSLHPQHPANRQRIEEDQDTSPMDADIMALASEPNTSFFTDPFFQADAKTFQDHLYSGWLTSDHEALVQEYSHKVTKSEAHAPWKDETWESEHPVAKTNRDVLNGDGPAGDASSLSLRDLAKHHIIRVGDVLAYRRAFSQLDITVSKDVLIRQVHPSTQALTVLVAPSTQTHLPLAYLTVAEADLTQGSGPLQEMMVTSPSQLEAALLDVDSRIERGKRPNGNAWKSVGVWRLKDVEGDEREEEVARGGREYRGTLFYLRGCFYDDM